MKKLAIAIVLISASVLAIAQQTATPSAAAPAVATQTPASAKMNVTPPSAVAQAFKTASPNAQNVIWRQAGDNGSYVAIYSDDKNDRNEVSYDASGNLLRSRMHVDPATLPQPAKDYLTKNFPNQQAQMSSLMKDGKTGVSTYTVFIAGQRLLFDQSGNFEKTMEMQSPAKAAAPQTTAPASTTTPH
jgi:hypothetical protein